MADIANLAQNYEIIIAGDFNRKMSSPDEMMPLVNISDDSRSAAFNLTEPGLQLHDTLDAIIVPRNYSVNEEQKKGVSYN